MNLNSQEKGDALRGKEDVQKTRRSRRQGGEKIITTGILMLKDCGKEEELLKRLILAGYPAFFKDFSRLRTENGWKGYEVALFNAIFRRVGLSGIKDAAIRAFHIGERILERLEDLESDRVLKYGLAKDIVSEEKEFSQGIMTYTLVWKFLQELKGEGNSAQIIILCDKKKGLLFGIFEAVRQYLMESEIENVFCRVPERKGEVIYPVFMAADSIASHFSWVSFYLLKQGLYTRTAKRSRLINDDHVLGVEIEEEEFCRRFRSFTPLYRIFDGNISRRESLQDEIKRNYKCQGIFAKPGEIKIGGKVIIKLVETIPKRKFQWATSEVPIFVRERLKVWLNSWCPTQQHKNLLTMPTLLDQEIMRYLELFN